MKNWKNKYPLNTFKGETKKELYKVIESIVSDVCDEIDSKYLNYISDLKERERVRAKIKSFKYFNK